MESASRLDRRGSDLLGRSGPLKDAKKLKGRLEEDQRVEVKKTPGLSMLWNTVHLNDDARYDGGLKKHVTIQ